MGRLRAVPPPAHLREEWPKLEEMQIPGTDWWPRRKSPEGGRDGAPGRRGEGPEVWGRWQPGSSPWCAVRGLSPRGTVEGPAWGQHGGGEA